MENDNAHIQISVVIAVYNVAPVLRECLDSLVAQTFTQWELICVDDGSTDDSLQILESYQAQMGNMTILTQENQGAGMARNVGMEKACGKYLLFLDADDCFAPQLLEKMWQNAEATRADVTICRSQCFDHHTGKILPSDWLRKDYYLNGKTTFSPQEVAPCLFQFTYGWAWDKLFLRAFVQESGVQFPHFATSHDLGFTYLALALSKKISIIKDSLIFYRMNRNGSVSQTRSKHVTAPYDAANYLAQKLKQVNLYEQYQQTFLNFVCEFLIGHLGSMHPKSLQKAEYSHVREILFRDYKAADFGRAYYHSKATRLKMQAIRYMPYRIYSAVLSVHKALQRV